MTQTDDFADYPTLQDDEDIAFHEAGHAVLAYILRESLDHATIIPDEKSWGRTAWVGPPEYLREKKGPEVHGALLALQVTDIMMSLAGSVVDERRGCANLGALPDIAKACQTATNFWQDEETAQRFVEWCYDKTQEIFAYEGVWQATEAIARALLRTAWLSGEEIEQIIMAGLGPPPEHPMVWRRPPRS